MFEDNFKQRVLQVLNSVPYGKVTTYGNIAKLAGSPRAARQVGAILKGLPSDTLLPWHRVVNREGKIALMGEAYKTQYQRLIDEGVVFNQMSGHIDLKLFGWMMDGV